RLPVSSHCRSVAIHSTLLSCFATHLGAADYPERGNGGLGRRGRKQQIYPGMFRRLSSGIVFPVISIIRRVGMSMNNVCFFEANPSESIPAPVCPDQDMDLREEMFSEPPFEGIVGQSAAIRHVIELVETVAPSDSTVLLLGETGTGKELVSWVFSR